MADGVKISELTETSNINGDDHIIINQDGETKITKIRTLTDNAFEELPQFQKITELENRVTELEDLKLSVSNGKMNIAEAITDKGVETSATDSFQMMANNIMLIGSSEVFGEIVTDTELLEINFEQGSTFKIKLSKQPTSEQNVILSVNNDNIMMTPSTLSFTSSNWNVEQEVIVECANNDYEDSTLVLTLSTNNHQKEITLNVKNKQFLNYGQIIVSTTSLSFEPNSKVTFSVCLDSAPT